jgi:hypothetical protein
MVGTAAAVDLGEILKSPKSYVHEKVEVIGRIDKLANSPGKTTQFYVLQDDFGEAIRVRSTEGHPKAGERYRVTGVINIHSNSKEPYLGEIKRVLVDEQEAVAPPPEPEIEDDDGVGIIVGMVILGAAFIAMAIFVASKRKEAGSVAEEAVESDSPLDIDAADEPVAAAKAAANSPANALASPAEETTEVFETSTMKIELSPATMKFMPGSFEIISGEEEGNKIRIQGYPTANGAETTIGREVVKGDRRFAHLQLKEATVSRRQAQLVSQGGQYRLVNLGATNPSQVNGRELAVNESVELNAGDTVRFGEVELRFES